MFGLYALDQARIVPDFDRMSVQLLGGELHRQLVIRTMDDTGRPLYVGVLRERVDAITRHSGGILFPTPEPVMNAKGAKVGGARGGLHHAASWAQPFEIIKRPPCVGATSKRTSKTLRGEGNDNVARRSPQ